MATQSPLSTVNATQEAVSTIQNMGGLPVAETPTETAGPVVKAPTVKGGFSVPGNVALDPTQTQELLANMQSMIDKRTGGWNEFMGGLQDTMALATPPRLGGPTQAMAQRAASKRQEQEDIFNMRAQMAALKAGAAQSQNQREVMKQILGGDGGTDGAGAAPSVFGGTQQIPTEIRQAMAMDPVNAPTILQKYLTTTASETSKARLNPAWSTPTEVIDKQGQIIKVPLWQATELAMANPDNPKNRAVVQAASEIPGPKPTTGGVNQFNVGNVRPAGQSTGFQQPKSYDEGIQIMDNNLQSYGKKGIDTLRGVISRWAPPSENDTEALIKNAAQRLGINPDQKIDLSNPVQRQAIGTAIMLQEKGPKQLFAAAPTGTMTDATPPRAKPGESPESLKMRQEEWRKEQEAQREVQTKGRTEYAGGVGKAESTAAAGVDDAYTTSGDRKNRSTHSLQLMDDPGIQKMIGYLEKPGTSAAILRTLRDGITLGRLGDVNLKDFDATLAKAGASQDEIANFGKLVTNLKTDELVESRSLLKGQGQVSDSERKLVSNMIGSISNTTEALKTAIKWRQERAQLDQEMGRAFNKYRDAKGEYASFNAFMRSDGQQVIAAHNERLAKILGVSPDQVAGNTAYDRNAPAPQSETSKTQRRPLSEFNAKQ